MFESACVEVINADGAMTKDLSLAIHGKEMQREHWAITDVYMDAVTVLVDRVSCIGTRADDGTLHSKLDKLLAAGGTKAKI